MTAIDVDREWKLLIGGEWVEAAGGSYEIVDPNTTSVVGHAPEATVDQANEAAAAARDALPAWKAASRTERAEHLSRLADAIDETAATWIDVVQAETGSTINIAEQLQVGAPFIDRFPLLRQSHRSR